MINKAYEIITEALKPVIESQKFTRQGDEYVFSNSKKAFRINYNAERHIFELDVANLEGGEAEFYNVSNYLFDEASDERDARSVGGDFLDSLNNELGIQRSVALRRKDVFLPTKAAADATPGVEAFANRFLTLFPAYKDAYKDSVAQYNGFLPDYFFSTNAAPLLADFIQKGETKQFVKMVNMLDDYYVDGDNEVQSTITYSILGEMFRADATTLDSFVQLCQKNEIGSHLITPAQCMYKYIIKKNK